MKLYSLLILTKNTRKSKNNFKAPKKSEIVVFPGRILPCKQNKSALYITYSHVSDGKIKRFAANWGAHSQDTGGHTCSTDCLPNAETMPSACDPMLWEHSIVLQVYK